MLFSMLIKDKLSDIDWNAHARRKEKDYIIYPPSNSFSLDISIRIRGNSVVDVANFEHEDLLDPVSDLGLVHACELTMISDACMHCENRSTWRALGESLPATSVLYEITTVLNRPNVCSNRCLPACYVRCTNRSDLRTGITISVRFHFSSHLTPRQCSR